MTLWQFVLRGIAILSIHCVYSTVVVSCTTVVKALMMKYSHKLKGNTKCMCVHLYRYVDPDVIKLRLKKKRDAPQRRSRASFSWSKSYASDDDESIVMDFAE